MPDTSNNQVRPQCLTTFIGETTFAILLANEKASEMSDEWPIHDLEVLGACPVCQSQERNLMFSGLRDFTFATAPGEWTMWRCNSCDAAYLDPRPTPASIGRAYCHYYTHAGTDATLRERIASGLANNYINTTYGYRLPAIPFGALIWHASPRKSRSADQKIRHLPFPSHPRTNLLDAGCGNGEFMKLAGKLGFCPFGLDPDEQAIILARKAGLDVQKGTLPGSGLPRGSFDHITVNHVLEHLHQPLEALEELRELLKPGGRLWISQPNLGASGLKEFGVYWRGLEPPRHLTLFDTQGIRRILERCGFVDIKLLPPPPSASFYYRQSLYQKNGVAPYEKEVRPFWNKAWERKARQADDEAEADPQLAEALTMIARRHH
jgi:2-polyprenyl-3-methyl-5-hydroxy-6-metoxy-1,4-benzoquinol methylase